MSDQTLLKRIVPKAVTILLLVVAVAAAYTLFRRYTSRPWTRDAQVRATVVKITPRVSGELVRIAVEDNQAVRKGDLLFEIDPSSYQLAVNQAKVQLDQAREEVTSLEAAVRAADATVAQQKAAVQSAESKIDEAKAGVESAESVVQEAQSGVTSAKAYIAQITAKLEEARRESARAKRLADKKAGSVEIAEAKAASVVAYQAQLDDANAGFTQSQASLRKSEAAKSEAVAKLATAKNALIESQSSVTTAVANADEARANLGQSGEANVRIQNAKVQLERAELDLQWTKIYAPADGLITNMNLMESTFVSAGTPFALFVDSSSFRVDAYFQETKLKLVRPGAKATLVLMGHHDQPLRGVVESVGSAIHPPQLAETDGPDNLIPTIQPTFEWIRLAQRVPVRIRIDHIPDGLQLVAGTTVSVAID